MPGGSSVETVELMGGVVVGVAEDLPPVDPGSFDVLLTDTADPPRPWVRAGLDDLRGAHQAPEAAGVLVEVLRATEALAVPEGLVVESLAYSVLQHGAGFVDWLAGRAPPAPGDPEAGDPEAGDPEAGDPVRLTRDGEVLTVELNRPARHNAMDAAMRDALCDAFDLVAADPSIERVELRGGGPSFCSGGDLAEFGSARDPVSAHRIRVARSVGRRLALVGDRVTARLHGACIGAGIELGAFAGRVVAAPGTTIRLPELEMGLIPGAGGTVSITRRIGRHRAAYLALSGVRLDAVTAHDWGLVDELT